jgi:hypothetical protein
MADEEWLKTLADGRKVKFIYQELPVDGAFITAQLAGNEVAYSVVLTKARNPLSHDDVESHFKGELFKEVVRPCWKNLAAAAYFATVRNGTESLPSRCHDGYMLHKKSKKESSNAIRASVEQEMAKPRMAKSAKITELNLDTARIPEQPSTTIPGTVHKIIPSPRPGQPEEAQIAVDDGDHRHRDLRIENTFTDENGDYVRLKKGAHVQITVTAEPKNASADAKKRANG